MWFQPINATPLVSIGRSFESQGLAGALIESQSDLVEVGLRETREICSLWEILSQLAALFVATISIILTVVTIKMQRTRNRKSVLPIGHITVGDYENQIFVWLRNDGVGPMIIEKESPNWR